jgi:hypothetical protein
MKASADALSVPLIAGQGLLEPADHVSEPFRQLVMNESLLVVGASLVPTLLEPPRFPYQDQLARITVGGTLPAGGK